MYRFRWKTHPLATAMLLMALAFLLCHALTIPWPDNYFAWRHELMLLSGVELIMLMSLGMLLGMRPLWLEKLWGGLDKLYGLHRRLGIAAGLMLSAHWLLDLSPRWLIQLGLIAPRVRHAGPHLFSWTVLAKQVGEWAAWAVLGLVIIALLRMVPYGFWRKLHKLFAPVYLMGAFHSAILIPLSFWWTPLGWLLALLLLVGGYAALLSLRRKVGSLQRHVGIITAVESLPGNMLELRCAVPRWPGHQAGQFALLQLDAAEGAHPFTIASAWQGQGELRFVIKALGDYTRSLPGRLQPGAEVVLEGPYGGFTGTRDGLAAQGAQVWVAGGVGVTPFLAWLQAQWQPLPAPVDFFYCVRHAGEAVRLDELRHACARLGVRLHLLESAHGQRLTAQVLPATAADVWFCGPEGLGQSLQRQLASRPQPPRFHHEAFSLR
ncbi:ferric reductase-like transmembrane domain-containing protein [Aquitalea sp. ASV15]|uniref:ferredoxin reductase family protein n=1 Tax=Aquitalea sp. ASV15 TaxID=2795104 RepID=UPI0018EA7F06|nr:ferric reductase-like transmembrane domain-containing protein [Aquitalea sp. ASV15]